MPLRPRSPKLSENSAERTQQEDGEVDAELARAVEDAILIADDRRFVTEEIRKVCDNFIGRPRTPQLMVLAQAAVDQKLRELPPLKSGVKFVIRVHPDQPHTLVLEMQNVPKSYR
jgi:hypothetical protein